MRKMKKWLMGSGLIGLMIVLSGCVSRLEDGSPDTTGLVYRFLVEPLGRALTYIAANLGFGFGWAIIIVTIIVRFIILPTGINQSKKSMIQSEKMEYIKPQITLAQKKAKAAKTQEEQLAANQEMQSIYKENNMSMMGGIGCLPMLIQMPIFTALFFTAQFTPGIESASFYGIPLGERSILLVAIAGISYVAQSFISMIGVPEEQKKSMRSMMIVSPLMITFMSLSAPAGVTLYWVVGGLFGCFQTFITNVIMKPRIKEQVAQEMKENPPKVVVTPMDEVPKAAPKKAVAANPRPKNGTGRNAGKQQRKK